MARLDPPAGQQLVEPRVLARLHQRGRRVAVGALEQEGASPHARLVRVEPPVVRREGVDAPAAAAPSGLLEVVKPRAHLCI